MSLRVLPGGCRPDALPLVSRGHVLNVRPTHPTSTDTLHLSRQDIGLLVAALNAPGVASALAAVGARIANQAHPSLLPRIDDAPARGIARPVPL